MYLRVKARHAAGNTKDINSRVSNEPGMLIFKRVHQFDIELWINLLIIKLCVPKPSHKSGISLTPTTVFE